MPENSNTDPKPQCVQTDVISRFLWFLKKRRWSKYEHVMFVEDFRSGINNFEILRRKCEITGLTQYKRIYIKGCVHNLTSRLSQWYASQNGL